MRSRRRPLIALFALAMGAIAAPVAAHAAVRTLAGDVDSVWAAARAALRSDGWDIADEDRARGRIVTGARDINFREFGLYAEGMRHRLLVSVAPVGGGLTSVTVERQLYWEERLLWDSVRRPVTPPSDRVEVGVVESIPLFMPAATVTVVPPVAQSAVALPAARAPKVTYRVTGNGGPVQVTYRTAEGANDSHTTAALPWELSFDAHGAAPLYVSAVAQGASHLSVTCEILVDGAARSQSMSVGSSAIATCRTAAP